MPRELEEERIEARATMARMMRRHRRYLFRRRLLALLRRPWTLGRAA